MIKFGNIVLNVGSDWLDTNVEPITPDVYRVYTSAQYGTITANPSSGVSGTEVTLSNSPHPNYQFNSYSITGSTLKSPNKFDILSEDVYVVGNFDRIYNVILQQTTGGTITATPTKGINGTVITLSNSPTSTNYSFNGYTVTGATLYSGNKFNINGRDVTVRANWKYEPIPTTDQVKIGNQIWMNKSLAINDGKGGINVYNPSFIPDSGRPVSYLGDQYYYTWDAAKRLANSIQGWHLPTYDEVIELRNTMDPNAGQKLKARNKVNSWKWIASTTSSDGTDTVGFSAVGGGEYYYRSSLNKWIHDSIGHYYHFWCINGTSSWIATLYANDKLLNVTGTQRNNDKYLTQVRLIKDS